MTLITVSVVVYQSGLDRLSALLFALQKSSIKFIYLIDNSPYPQPEFEQAGLSKLVYIHTPQNLGYGKGHNLGIQKSLEAGADYHVVVNPDIELPEPDSLNVLATFMNDHTDVGLVMPKVVYKDGELQYLCKKLPTPFDLIFRRFLPGFLRRKFKAKMDAYELRHKDYNLQMDVPNLSGCFMFIRTKVLRQIGGFDKRYFMYLEDTDLSRRIGEVSRTVYYPGTTVVHGYAKDSYKNPTLLKYHIKSAVQYFNKWGWVFDAYRKRKNQSVS